MASLRDGGELNNVALHAINEWIALHCIDDAERVHAQAFRALANYTFGQVSDAVRSAEDALVYAEKTVTDISLIAAVKMNLAYFLAEEFYQNPSAYNKQKTYDRIQTLLSESEPSYIGNRRGKFDDTCRAVAIVFGNEQDVRLGLHRCHQALLAATRGPEWEAANAYFRLHEHRACRRLLEYE